MKVSVLMPVYNGAQYLQEAIDSILGQTYKDFEFVIIDDGSTDESTVIIANNAAKDNRIVSLRNENNLGICVALNKGLDISKGEYIVRMDCDDISEQNRLEVQVAFMDSHPEFGLVGSKIRIFGSGIRQPYVFDFEDDWRMCMANMLFASCVAHPSVIIRTEILRKYNLYYDDEFRGLEDFYLWWQLAKYTKITNIQQPLLNYRQHIKQVTKKVYDERHFAKGRRFLNERLFFWGIGLSDFQKDLMLRYIYNFRFDDNQVEDFIFLCKRILLDMKKSRPELRPFAKLLMAGAISQCVNNSDLLKKTKKYYACKAFFSGCISFTWFLKYFIRQILSR